MDREDFTIYPLQGFGKLKFGQSVAQAKSFANIYGDITGDGSMFDEERWLEWREELRQNPYLTEEMVIEMTEGYREDRKDMYSFYFNGNIILFFNKDKLYDIRLSDADFPAYLGEQDLFALYGEPVAQYMAHYFNENPYLWEKAMFFIRHGIALDGYFDKFEGMQIFWRGASVRKGARGIFLGPENIESRFDYESTTLYKILP